jgi:hypothetical protein
MKKAQEQSVSTGRAYSTEGAVHVVSIKTVILALFLAVPCAWIAISVSDNVTIADSVRYVLSPGTMLGLHVFMQPTHSWHEMGERLSQWFAIAFFTDMAYYALLIFGFVTVTRVQKTRVKIT